MVVQTKKILKNLIFKAKPDEIYEAWMDSKKHTKFTESKAKISNEVGGNFVCGNGYMKGKSIELIPGEKIVQQWQADEAGLRRGLLLLEVGRREELAPIELPVSLEVNNTIGLEVPA